MKKLLKTETTQWFETIGEDGVRRIRKESKTEKWFPDELDNDGQSKTRHNPVTSHVVEHY